MSNAVIGALRVSLGMDSASFEKGLDGAQRTLNRFNRDMQKLSAKFTGIGQTLTLGLTVPIAAFGAASVQAAQQSADAFAQVEAALKSMGGASGKTAADLQASAKALQDVAAIDDDEILRKVTANLLTFGKIAGPTFDRAQVAVVDLATRMKMDLQAATLLVGKALNDPVKGLTAMGRAGIQFTADQKTLIKSLVDTGRTAEAQAIILGELERQFGGSAKAAADANPYARLQIAFGELTEVIGAKLLPVITPVIEKLTALLNGFDKLSPAMQNFVLIGGLIAAAIGPVLVGVGMLISAVGTISALLAGPAVSAAVGAFVGLFTGPAVAALAAFLAPFAPIILAVGALVAVFFLFRKQIMPVLEEWGRTVAEVLGPKITPLIEAAKSLFASFSAALGQTFSALGAAINALFGKGGSLEGPMQFFLDVATRVFNGVVSIVGTQIEVLTDILNALAALFRGDFSAMWGYLKDAAVTMASGIVRAFAAMFPDVIAWVQKTWQGVKTWLVDKFSDVVKAVQQKIAAVTGFFKDMWDAVVGHSYVPDMVDGIRDHFARLDAEMVKPALGATAEVEAAFAAMHKRIGIPLPGSRQNARSPNAPANDNGHGGASPDVTIFGGKAMSTERVEELRAQFVSFGQSFTDAVRAGRLKDFFADVANQFVDKLINQGINSLFNVIGSSSGGGAGGWVAAIASIFTGGGGSTPGFATGGSFTVGGSGAMDSKLVQFRATPGEMVNITKGERGQRQTATNVFDMRGAVVTQDLLNQMNQIAASGDAQVLGAVAREKTRQDKASRYTVARARR
jgi:hypothetical protein